VNGLDGGGNGRDSGGRFAKGNRGGPGRPPRAIERDYLRALSDRCPLETWGRIVDKAVEDALNGDGQEPPARCPPEAPRARRRWGAGSASPWGTDSCRTPRADT
jgi:hypothetical protein